MKGSCDVTIKTRKQFQRSLEYHRSPIMACSTLLLSHTARDLPGCSVSMQSSLVSVREHFGSNGKECSTDVSEGFPSRQ